ncbi:MAG TPA: response regulator, partial [Ktedonobacterales bacterium]|nr:response regulator [Ktedonobacterales bacterium]
MSEADTRSARGRGKKGRTPAQAGIPATNSADRPPPTNPQRNAPGTLREPETQPEQEPALVLIVEDEQPIAEALSFMVEDAGYTTIIASHGQQGLEIARARRLALIFTDLMMPRMDGAAFIAALKAEAAKDGALPPPPIILMTAAGFDYAQKAG